MQEFSIKEITNGWILQGWIIERKKNAVNMIEEKEIFLPTISAVADILKTWQLAGFINATIRAGEKYGGQHG